MGHLFLDAYHATGDEYYYRAAEQVASALDAGAASVRRMELHRRLRRRGVAARSGTTPSARTPGASKSSSTTTATRRSTMPARRNRRSSSCGCTSRRRIAKYKAPLDKAIKFVLDSQYPIGVWPQRFPQAPTRRRCTACPTTPASRPSMTTWQPRTWISCCSAIRRSAMRGCSIRSSAA